MVRTGGPVGLGWTVVMRRQPARIVAGRSEGGYTNMFEIIPCDCGDDPSLDYREVSPLLQRIRGPYPASVGVAVYKRHLERHPNPPSVHQPSRPIRDVNAPTDRHGSPDDPAS